MFGTENNENIFLPSRTVPRDFHPFYQTSLLSNYIFNLDTDTGEADRDISYCILPGEYSILASIITLSTVPVGIMLVLWR